MRYLEEPKRRWYGYSQRRNGSSRYDPIDADGPDPMHTTVHEGIDLIHFYSRIEAKVEENGEEIFLFSKMKYSGTSYMPEAKILSSAEAKAENREFFAEGLVAIKGRSGKIRWFAPEEMTRIIILTACPK